MKDKNGTVLAVGQKVMVVTKNDGTENNLEGFTAVVVDQIVGGETVSVDINGLLYALPEEIILAHSPENRREFKLWDWVLFAGERFRVVQKIAGNVRISNGAISRIVHSSVLQPCMTDEFLDKEFKDCYPEE